MDIPWLLQHVMGRGSEGRDISPDTGMLGSKAELPRQRNRVKVRDDAGAVILPDFHTIFAIIDD